MKALRNMKIGHRLGLGFALILTLAVTIGVDSLWKMTAVGDKMRNMVADPLSTERLASDLSLNISSAIVRTTAVAKSSDPALAEFFSADTKDSSKRSSELIKKIEALLDSDEEKRAFEQISALRGKYISTRDAVFKLKAEGNAEEALKSFEGSFIPAARGYQAAVTAFVDLQRKELDSEATRASGLESSARTQIIALTLLVTLIGVVCAWRLTVGITRPIRSAVTAARRVADGDLGSDIAVTSRDETGELLQALKDMNANLLKIVSDVRQSTDAIAAASQEIASGNLDLSSRTEQQAASLEETASSLEELTSTVRQNADNAHQANKLASAASGVAAKGGAVIGGVVTTMGDINTSARKIVDIISVIDGIAFQTNILALNAAVEAARAGEQGRGFAVVAGEVRTLAQRSAAAAKEIKELIDNSVDKVEAGSKLVNEAGKTMEEIVDSVRRVTDIMGEIASASAEQTTGIEQINQAVANMDEATQQNAALVEEAAAAAGAMEQQTTNLAQTVAVFKLGNADARNTRQDMLRIATA